MSSKRLHLHSLPLMVMVLATTGAMAVSVLAMRGNTGVQALVRPVLKAEPAKGGLATLSLNDEAAIEPAGAYNQIIADEDAVPGAAKAATSIVLQLALEQAVEKAAN